MLLVACSIQCAGAQEVEQAADSDNRSGTIALNFSDVSLRDFIASMAASTGRNFVVDPRVNGRVTIISARPVSEEAAYEAFLAVLEINGFTALDSGEFTRIVPLAEGKHTVGAEVIDPAHPAFGEGMVVRLIELKNLPAPQAVAVVRPLLPQHAYIAPIPGTSLLILVDTGANVERLLQVIERIDAGTDQELELMRVEHLSAATVAKTLTAVMPTLVREGNRPAVILPDERLNAILVAADEATRLKLRGLLRQLDVPSEGAKGLERIQLRYVSAEVAAKFIEATLAKGLLLNSNDKDAPGAVVGVIPEPNTDSLFVTAPPRVVPLIRNLVEGFDVRPKQVLVEAIIAELSTDKSAELGITWAAVARSGSPLAALTNFANSGLGVAQLAGADESDVANAPDGLTAAAGKLKDGQIAIAALLRALAADSRTNILSAPVVLTVDRREASITVGQEVPFVTGSFTGTGSGGAGNVNPFQTIQRSEVGVTLRVTPRVNFDDTVELDLEQEVSSLAASAPGAVDLVTNQRRLKTQVLADDGEVIVLGGLIDDITVKGDQRVPVLGRIPLLGAAFRYSKSSQTKRNLMIFLKATVLRDERDSQTVSAAEYERALDLLLKQRDIAAQMREKLRPRTSDSPVSAGPGGEGAATTQPPAIVPQPGAQPEPAERRPESTGTPEPLESDPRANEVPTDGSIPLYIPPPAAPRSQ